MTFRVHAHRGADVALAAFLLQQGCSSSRELVEHFLEQGADPTCTTTMRGTGSKHRLVVEGTSVMVAARLKQWEVVSRLIEAGTDLNVKDSLGSSLAKPAVEDGQTSILALLRGRNVPAFDALAEHGSVIVMSLASGFWPKTDNILAELRNGGRSALMASIQRGHADMVAYLLELGCSPNNSSANRQTPLMMAACMSRCKEARRIIKSLLAHGADKDAVWNGKTALMLVEAAAEHLDNRAGTCTSLTRGCQLLHRKATKM